MIFFFLFQFKRYFSSLRFFPYSVRTLKAIEFERTICSTLNHPCLLNRCDIFGVEVRYEFFSAEKQARWKAHLIIDDNYNYLQCIFSFLDLFDKTYTCKKQTNAFLCSFCTHLGTIYLFKIISDPEWLFKNAVRSRPY